MRSFVQKISVLYGLMLMAPSAIATTIDNFSFYTEEHPPLSFTENGEARGIITDIFIEILDELNSPKGRKDIVTVSWTRGYNETLRKPNTLLFGTYRTASREQLFKWVGPIMNSHLAIIAKKEKRIKITSPADFGGYIFGTLRHEASEQLLMETGLASENIYHLSSPHLIARMLAFDRIDLWPYEEMAAKWILNQNNYDALQYEVVWTLAKPEYYFAFHKETDDRIINEVQTALDEIKKRGRIQEIIASYLSGS